MQLVGTFNSFGLEGKVTYNKKIRAKLVLKIKDYKLIYPCLEIPSSFQYWKIKEQILKLIATENIKKKKISLKTEYNKSVSCKILITFYCVTVHAYWI